VKKQRVKAIATDLNNIADLVGIDGSRETIERLIKLAFVIDPDAARRIADKEFKALFWQNKGLDND
jgi:hypothetical protein